MAGCFEWRAIASGRIDIELFAQVWEQFAVYWGKHESASEFVQAWEQLRANLVQHECVVKRGFSVGFVQVWRQIEDEAIWCSTNFVDPHWVVCTDGSSILLLKACWHQTALR